MGTAITEITELDPDRVDGVGTPANGASFLLIKAASDTEECSTCKGKDTIMEGNRECPDCKGSGKVAKSESAEADEQEEEMTGSAAKRLQQAMDDGPWETMDKALSKKDREGMPSSSFAFIDKNGGKHLPVHDEGHTLAAKGRLGQQDFSEAKGDPGEAKEKAAAKIAAAAKKFGIGDAKKGDVQDALDGGATPTATGTDSSMARSGDAGAATTELPDRLGEPRTADGGESTVSIPAEAKINGPEAMKTLALAGFAAVLEQVEKDEFSPPSPEESTDPGSMPWESYDAATLQQVARCLANCCGALDCIRDRERMEAATGDSSDQSAVWDLEEAATALEFALGVAARLSFHEAAEGEATKSAVEGYAVKVGRTLSGKNMSAIRAAHEHLGSVIDGAEKQSGDAEKSEDKKIMTTVTKDELTESIAASSVAAVESILAKRAEEEAEKESANNDGDVSEAEIKPKATSDADDVGSVGGGVTKGAEAEVADEPVMKQVLGQIEELKKGLDDRLSSVEEMVTKIAKRPRAGGPSLDGQVRGVHPAAEGRLGDAAKEADDGEIGRLEKALGEETDPVRKGEIGTKLTHARLVKLYSGRQL